MGLIHITRDISKVSFIGLAKNTGKTVALQKLLDEISASGAVCGLTSIGHDGEEFDQINILIKKPRIYVSEGFFVATTDKLFALGGAQFKIVRTTDFNTPLGRVQIGRVEKAGLIEIAGPSTSSGVSYVTDIMLDMGAGKVLIDGAINRKAISSPEYTDGLIIATGAALDKDQDRVVNETVEAVNHIRLPHYKAGILTDNLNGVVFISRDGRIRHTQESIMADKANFFKAVADRETESIISFKPVVESVINQMVEIISKRKRRIVLVVSDYTRLFPGNRSMSFYEKKGIDIRVLFPSNLLALTLNPVAPLSHFFDSDSFQHAIKQKVQGLPVYDVLSPQYQ
ncbi:MAG: hypothetical protein V1775_07445 [Bacteroidota bacterium]